MRNLHTKERQTGHADGKAAGCSDERSKDTAGFSRAICHCDSGAGRWLRSFLAALLRMTAGELAVGEL